MTREFLLQRLPVVPYLAVEITGVGKPQFMPNWTFDTWEKLEAFFLAMGGAQEELSKVKQALESTGNAHLVLKNAKEPTS